MSEDLANQSPVPCLARTIIWPTQRPGRENTVTQHVSMHSPSIMLSCFNFFMEQTNHIFIEETNHH